MEEKRPPPPSCQPAEGASPAGYALPTYHQEPLQFSQTSVYLPGLSPDTNEAWLYQYGSHHGRVRRVDILASKPSQVTISGRIRFTEQAMARNCIIHAREQLGLNAWFSNFNLQSEMDNLADPESTNLYLSNLPMHWDEQHLIAELFSEPDFEVKSCRILRMGDKSGIIVAKQDRGSSRGVGFARLATREQAEQAIFKLHGLMLSCSFMGLPLSVRFADSDAQRALKASLGLQNLSGRHPALRQRSRSVAFKTPPRPIMPPMSGSAPPVVNAPGFWSGPVIYLGASPQAAPYYLPMPPPPAYAPPGSHQPVPFIPMTPEGSPVMMMNTGSPPSPVSPLMFRFDEFTPSSSPPLMRKGRPL